MLSLAILLAAAPPSLEPMVLDTDPVRGLLLVEVPVINPLANVDVESNCENKAFGGMGRAYLVLGGAKPETLDIVGWPEKAPCPTKASAVKARAAAKAALAGRGLDPVRAEAPKVTPLKATGPIAVDEEAWTNDDTLERHFKRTLVAGGVALRRTEDTATMNGAGDLDVESWLVEHKGAVFVLDRLHFTSMRDDHLEWRVESRVRLPTNGVDVPALAKVDLGACGVSVVQALTRGDKAPPVTRSKASRSTSVAYVTDACMAVATALSKLVPGGATVDTLTWDSRAPVVVALGEPPRR